MTRFRAALRRRTSESESGMTLVELLVSMGILTVIVGIFMGGVVVMTKDTSRAQGVSNAGDAARKVFQRMDKQARYANNVNGAGSGTTSGTWYVEYLVSGVQPGQSPLCVQWRYTQSTRKLETRSWRDVAPRTPSAWLTMATNMRNDLAVVAQRPFTWVPADTVNLKQQQ